MQKPSYEELEREIQDHQAVLVEKIAANEKYKAGYELYQTLFDHAGVAITVTDVRTGNVVAYNKKAYEELGYTKKEYDQLKREDYILESPEKRIEITKTILKHGAFTWTQQLRKKDGEIIEVFRSSVKLKIGGRTYVHDFRINITEELKTNQALLDSEEKFRNVLENMDEGYYEVDLQGNFFYCNKAAIRIYGYSPDELIGMNFRDHMDPVTAEKVHAYFNNLYLNGENKSTIEYEIIRKDGSIALLETSVSIIKTDRGDIIGFRGIARDNTEKKNLENALKESEAFYRSLFKHAGFPMTLVDYKTGNVVDCNKRAYEDLGYTADEFLGMDSRSVVSLNEKDYEELYKNILKKDSAYFANSIKKKNGEIIEVLGSTVIVTLGGKKYVHGISVDVTEQNKTMRKLRENEKRFRSIFDTAPDPIFLSDLFEGKIIDANNAACIYSGYGKDELSAMSMKDLVSSDHTISPDSSKDKLQETGAYFYDAEHITKTGEKLMVEINSRIIEQKGTAFVLSIVRDVTQRKKAEAELAQQRATLEQMIRERSEKLEAVQKELIKHERLGVLGELAATVSHELRNPLGVIQSSNYYLRKKLSNPCEEAIKHLNNIDTQVDTCDAIVADLLEYTRGGSSKGEKSEITSWLNPLLEQIFKSKNIRLTLNISPNLPDVNHDHVKMERVIFNIMDNAIQAIHAKKEKYADASIPYEPEIILSIENIDSQLIMEIKDNGIGMDQQTLEKAFHPLFTTQSVGTGLGLANVKKIIEAHDGQIFLNSFPNEGTSIKLTLPINVSKSANDKQIRTDN